jgi:hypothetical protein
VNGASETNLSRRTPRWRTSICDLDRKRMSDTSVTHVVSAIRRMMERPRDAPDFETVNIAPDGVISPQTTGRHAYKRIQPKALPTRPRPAVMPRRPDDVARFDRPSS